MSKAGGGKIVRVTSAVITGVIALSGYAGVVGLMGGGISFGDTINARLPFGSLVLAGAALLAIVAVPMTVAAVAAGRATRHSPDIVFGAGLLLVAWIAVELAFIKAYSWFHPTYLVAAIVVLGLGWLMNGAASPAAWHAGTSDDESGREIGIGWPNDWVADQVHLPKPSQGSQPKSGRIAYGERIDEIGAIPSIGTVRAPVGQRGSPRP